jgi:hypothetical protein
MSAHSKRKANVQLTKDEPGQDSDEEGEEPVNRKATAEQMKQRRIVRAKRPTAVTTAVTTSAATPVAAEASATPTASATATLPIEPPNEAEKSSGNVFANVTLTSSNVFGASTSFPGFGGTAAPSSSAPTPSSSTNPKKADSVFGSSVTSFQGFGSTTATTAAKTTEPTTHKPFGGFAAFSSTSTAATATATTTTNKPFVFASALTESNTNKADTAAAAALVLPHDYVVQSGEEHEDILYESRAKAYRWGIPTTEASAAAVVNKPEAPSVPPSEMLLAAQEEKTEETTVPPPTDATQPHDDDDNNTTEEPTTSTTTTTSSSNTTRLQWIEVGVGPVRVLQQRSSLDNDNNNNHTTFGRLVQRRQPDPKEKATKLLVNCNLGRESTCHVLGDSHVQIATMGHTCLQFLFKFPSPTQAQDFQATVQRVVDSSKSFLDADGNNDNDNHGDSLTKGDANPQS